MNKTIVIILTLVIIIGGIFLWMHHTSAPTTSDMSVTTSAPHETTNPGAVSGMAASSSATTTYTLADIAKHPDSSSCWAAINGGVYDLTNWINQHPGGPARILSICGTDGSAAFNGQHGSDPNPRPKAMLATMKIGTLAQ